MHELRHTGREAGGDRPLGKFDVRLRECRSVGLAANALQDTDEVDHRIAAADETRERRRISHIGLHHVDRRQRDQMFRALAAAGRYDDEVRALDELLDEVTTDEP